MPELIFGTADVAVALGVNDTTVRDWVKHLDTIPEPAYETPAGWFFWTTTGLTQWRDWYAKRPAKGKYERVKNTAVERRRAVIAEVMSQLEEKPKEKN